MNDIDEIIYFNKNATRHKCNDKIKKSSCDTKKQTIKLKKITKKLKRITEKTINTIKENI